MRTLQPEIEQLLATEGVIARREHPELASTIDWLVRNGSLRAVLPGVYAQLEMCDLFPTRVRALMRWDPDAILVGRAAARASFWPEIRAASVSCSLRHQAARSEDMSSPVGGFPQSLSSAGQDCASPPRR